MNNKPGLTQKELEAKLQDFTNEMMNLGFVVGVVAVTKYRTPEEFDWLDTNPEEPMRGVSIRAPKGSSMAALADLASGLESMVERIEKKYFLNKGENKNLFEGVF